MDPIFLASIKNGELVFNNLRKFEDYLIPFEDKEVEVIVRKLKKERSNEQNRYYWGVVIKLLSEHIGYIDEEMHEALKLKFLRDDSRKIPTLRSTTDLTTIEFEEYLEKIRIWAAQELNCYIPLPNEVDFQ